MTPMLSKVIFYALVLLNIFIVIFFVLTLYPFKVVELKGVEMLTPIVKAGQPAQYRAKFCKFYAVPAETQRILVDHYEYFLSKEVSNTKGTGCHTRDFTIPIPLWAEPGTYHVHTDLSHTLFGFRKIPFSYDTPDFQVIK